MLETSGSVPWAHVTYSLPGAEYLASRAKGSLWRRASARARVDYIVHCSYHFGGRLLPRTKDPESHGDESFLRHVIFIFIQVDLPEALRERS